MTRRAAGDGKILSPVRQRGVLSHPHQLSLPGGSNRSRGDLTHLSRPPLCGGADMRGFGSRNMGRGRGGGGVGVGVGVGIRRVRCGSMGGRGCVWRDDDGRGDGDTLGRAGQGGSCFRRRFFFSCCCCNPHRGGRRWIHRGGGKSVVNRARHRPRLSRLSSHLRSAVAPSRACARRRSGELRRRGPPRPLCPLCPRCRRRLRCCLLLFLFCCR